MKTRTILIPPTTVSPPAAGELMAGPAPGGSRYRIVRVTVLRTAGEVRKHRLRIECVLVGPDVTADEVLHPWRLNASRPVARPGRAAMPEQTASPLLLGMGVTNRAMIERLQRSVPLLFSLGLAPLLEHKAQATREQQSRIAKLGQGAAANVIRLKAIRAADGALLREADVETDPGAVDPDDNRVQRVRRADPLRTLLKHGSVNHRQFDAAEALRADMEMGTPALGGASQSEIHIDPWTRVGMTDRQIACCASLRDAIAGVAPRNRLVLAWMIGGGSIAGFAAFAHTHNQKAAHALRGALDAVAVHYFGAER